MRIGLTVSAFGHAAVLLWGLIAFPNTEPFFVEPVDALPVDLVPLSEMTRTQVGERTAPKENAPAPKPADKPVEAPKDAPEPGKKPSEAAKPTPPAEPSQTAATQPEPSPEAEPAPQAEPAPEAEPEPAPQAEAAPEPPKPVKVVPQSKPRPPRRTQTAATPPSTTREPEKEFDPNEISNLLNKVTPSGGQQTATNEPAGLGAREATRLQGLSTSDLDLMVSKIKERWNYVPDAFPSDLVVVVQFSLTRDGHLASTPQIMNSHPYPRFRQLAEAAVRAIIAVDRSDGFNFLPADRYDGNGGWNTVLANLRPQ
ncbi:cell envelope biogenesis protein TolA [Breoghania sp.]|uniref:cell envelope biogenesis protein TolA n=1 Tax=Breoghania sp. TaxID=2065378 RepID=UPI002AA86F0A|nr:cell envelope biogenesis protein TolA [Breoghania sp.]